MWKCFEEGSAHTNKVLIISDNFFELNFIDTCDIYNPGENRGSGSLAIWKLCCLLGQACEFVCPLRITLSTGLDPSCVLRMGSWGGGGEVERCQQLMTKGESTNIICLGTLIYGITWAQKLAFT